MGVRVGPGVASHVAGEGNGTGEGEGRKAPARVRE